MPSGSICPSGGIEIVSGLDANADNILDDPAEVANRSVICNGADGSNGSPGSPGLKSLVVVTPEPVGPNCSAGGARIEAGLDADADLILDVGEVTSTGYACNFVPTPVIAAGNFSFEAGVGCAPAGWTQTGCMFGAVSAVSNFGVPAADGVNVLGLGGTDVDGADVVGTTITGLLPGASYRLTFDMAPEAGANSGRPDAHLTMTLTSSSVPSANFSAANPDPSGCCWTPFIAQSLVFMATATTVDISMHSDVSVTPSWEMLLDNFQIVPAP